MSSTALNGSSDASRARSHATPSRAHRSASRKVSLPPQRLIRRGHTSRAMSMISTDTDDDGSESDQKVPKTKPHSKDKHRNLTPSASIYGPQSDYSGHKEDESPDQLEKRVQMAMNMLNELESVFKSQKSAENEYWVKYINDTRNKYKEPCTIIAILGMTGAGKSSVINAVLMEEGIVPTSNWRACTSVVTEIRYRPQHGYDGEIEFMSPEEWRKILIAIFNALLDGEGNMVTDAKRPDTEASIAYAQLKAVYPELSDDEVLQKPIDKLMAHANVACLGQSIRIKSGNAHDFQERLKVYIDSKDPNDASSDTTRTAHMSEPEVWPLIRVVRIRLKANALSTGAVIVDLPGIYDTNPARAAVSRSYLKQSTATWVLAPMIRAVNDKAAEHLMGDSFKRQLKMDGGLSNITFICSKTDDISLTESLKSQAVQKRVEAHAAREAALEQEIAGLGTKKEQSRARLKDLDKRKKKPAKQVKTWKALGRQRKEDLVVYAPGSAGNIALSMDDIDAKVEQLERDAKSLRKERQRDRKHVKKCNREIKALKQTLDATRNNIAAICITHRNEVSRAAIGQHFAEGLRKLDHQIAEEEDAANHDPDVDLDDYTQMAAKLPIFCVSSRAYQKLNGRLVKEQMPSGFKNTHHTGIPALQRHCINLTSAKRAAAARRFLSSAIQLRNSFETWASSNGISNLHGRALKKQLELMLGRELQGLRSNIYKHVDDFMSKFSEAIATVRALFPQAVRKAVSSADATCERWGRPVNKDDYAAGGVAFQTYRALCACDGRFTTSRGFRNFNAEQAEPILQLVSPTWEKVFVRSTSRLLRGIPDDMARDLRSFHDRLAQAMGLKDNSDVGFERLEKQIPDRQNAFSDALPEIQETITDKQQNIWPQIEAQVEKHMAPAYSLCLRQVRNGAFYRMKECMRAHVKKEKHSMFKNALDHVDGELNTLLRKTREVLVEHVDPLIKAVEMDYKHAIMGRREDEANSPEARQTRATVFKVVTGPEASFEVEVDIKTEPGIKIEDDMELEDDDDDDDDDDDTESDTDDSDSGSDSSESDAFVKDEFPMSD